MVMCLGWSKCARKPIIYFWTILCKKKKKGGADVATLVAKHSQLSSRSVGTEAHAAVALQSLPISGLKK